MKKLFKKEWFILLLIFLLAFFLRGFRLTQSPPSLDWDEVAIGWNAKTIFHTRRDEFGTRLPLAFRSFGDYKSPLLIYLTAPMVGIFGLNEWAVRLPTVVIGSLTILVFYFLTKELFKKMSCKKLAVSHLAAIASLLLAISPWHLQFSRPAFEPSLALFWVVLASFLFLKALKQSWLFIPSCLSFILSLYSYHSPKIFLPLFLLFLFLIYKKKILTKDNLSSLAASLVIGVLLLYPLIKVHLGGGSARFSGTSIFYNEQEEKRAWDFNLALDLAQNYFSHFSPTFLFLGNDKNLRINIKEVGPLYLIELPFLIWGLLVLYKQRKENWAQFLLSWLFLSPIPAMIGRVAPHTIRAFNMLPALLIINSLGIMSFLTWLRKKKKDKQKTFCILFFIFYFLNFIYYFYSYHFCFSVYAAKDWQYGYKQMARYVQQQEDQVNQIIITSAYGQPHIFTYFFQQRDPMEIFWGQMVKYRFRDINWEQDQYLENVLLVGTPEQIPLKAIPGWQKIEKEIYFPDGSVAFRIIRK